MYGLVVSVFGWDCTTEKYLRGTVNEEMLNAMLDRYLPHEFHEEAKKAIENKKQYDANWEARGGHCYLLFSFLQDEHS